MGKLMLLALATATLALLLPSPSIAADNTNAKTTHAAMKTSANRSSWASQTISGTLTIVDAGKKLVVIQTADGVPYDVGRHPRDADRER
jgi:hypothetical protein